MNFRIAAFAVLFFTMFAVAIWLANAWWVQRQWFALQHQQMATILRLQDFPPPVAGRGEWENEIVTLHNVWGNVTYMPSYSQISNAEMQSLQASLEQILSQTTSENSIQSVEQVYGMLLGRSQNTRFVPAYRDEFRAQFGVPVEAVP